MASTDIRVMHFELVAMIQCILGQYPGKATGALLEYFQNRQRHLGAVMQDVLPIRVFLAISNQPFARALSLGAIWALYLAAAHCLDEVQDEGDIAKVYSSMVAIGVASQIVRSSQIPPQTLHEILEAFGSVIILGANAQLQESRSKQPSSEGEYFKRIAGKAAMLIAAGIWAAGRLAGLDKEDLKALKEVGMAWGMAMQIADDCQDLEEDLKSGLYTLPVIKGIAQNRHQLHPQLINGLKAPQSNSQEIIHLLEQMGVMESCRQLVAAYQAQMSAGLQTFPELEAIFQEIGLPVDNNRVS